MRQIIASQKVSPNEFLRFAGFKKSISQHFAVEIAKEMIEQECIELEIEDTVYHQFYSDASISVTAFVITKKELDEALEIVERFRGCFGSDRHIDRLKYLLTQPPK